MVDQFFPPTAQRLARMVYGKRAASSLYALGETLRRRYDHMGAKSEAEAALIAESMDPGDDAEVDEAKVINASSVSAKAERSTIKHLVDRMNATICDPGWQPSTRHRLSANSLATHGIDPGNREQAGTFTSFTSYGT